MAGPKKKKKQEEAASYKAEVAALRAEGPQRLYVLWGQEEYLREQFLAQVRNACLPDGGDEFSLHRLDGAKLELQTLADAVDAVPFLSERSFIEVRGCDLNRLAEAESARLAALAADLPDYCTLVFVMDTDFVPDGRKKLTKTLREHGKVLQFAQQKADALILWVPRRFAALGKRIQRADAEYLIQITGGLMSRMIPEIEKIAAYAAAETVTRADIDAVTEKTPDAQVFQITDLLAQGNRDGAMRSLAELVSMKDFEAIPVIAAIAGQMRRLYAVRLAQEQQLSQQEMMKLAGVEYDFVIRKLQQQARRFSRGALERAIERCAEADYTLKHTAADEAQLVQDTLLQIMLEADR